MGTRRHLAVLIDTPRNTNTVTMNSRALVALLLCGLMAATDATFIIAAATGTTVAAGSVAAGVAALGLGALAVLKGALIGAALSRGKRDLSQVEQESVEVAINVAQQIDSAACIPKLLCHLEALPAEQVTPSMAVLLDAFNGNQKLKVPGGVYDFAAAFGAQYARNDPKVCDQVFAKCILPVKQLYAMLETTLSC